MIPKTVWLLFPVFFLFLFISPASACPTTADLNATGVSNATRLTDCLELARFEIPTGFGPVPVSIYGFVETDMSVVRKVEDALVRSGAVLDDLAALGSDPIDVFISPDPYSATILGDDDAELTQAAAARSVTTGPDNPPKCIISIFPRAFSTQTKFLIAHEFFHCVQFLSFGSAQSHIGSKWWVEGTAEWFASIVYQGRAYSDEWVSGFDAISNTTPVTQMNYESVVFFWWLDQEFGAERVIQVLEGMPSTGISQDDALAGIIDDEQFLSFVKAYLERRIIQPGGRAAASIPEQGEVFSIDEDTDLRLEAPRFLTYRAYLDFACGGWMTKLYDRKGEYAVLREPKTNWEALPASFRSTSTGTIRFLVVGAATGSSGFSVSIQARKSPCIPCQLPDYSTGPQACLVGEWHLAGGGIGTKIGNMLQDVPELDRVDYPDLDGVLIFNPDGTFSLRADDDGSMDSVTASKGIFSSRISITMEKEGTWSTNGNKLIQCYLPMKSISIDQSATSPDGVTERLQGFEYQGPLISYTEKRKFTCNERQLDIVQKAFLAPTIKWHYEK